MLLLRREPSNDGDKCVMAVLNDQCLQWFTPQEQHLTREKGLTVEPKTLYLWTPWHRVLH